MQKKSILDLAEELQERKRTEARREIIALLRHARPSEVSAVELLELLPKAGMTLEGLRHQQQEEGRPDGAYLFASPDAAYPNPSRLPVLYGNEAVAWPASHPPLSTYRLERHPEQPAAEYADLISIIEAATRATRTEAAPAAEREAVILRLVDAGFPRYSDPGHATSATALASKYTPAEIRLALIVADYRRRLGHRGDRRQVMILRALGHPALTPLDTAAPEGAGGGTATPP